MCVGRPIPALLLALLVLFSAGCGDDQQPEPQPQPKAEDPGWSDPAAQAATGSPDGDTGALRTAAALLGHLRKRVEAGEGPGTDPTFGQDVEAVAAVLWAPDAPEAERRAAHVHVQLANTAGDVAKLLKRDAAVALDESERRVHDAWLEAASKAPDAYRTWCAEAGAALLRAREEAVRKKLLGK
ncbi:MAG: hypothetical protein QNJ90_02745 [Planctomycetota bacterium]|nr:hypothetical protein [Planctomycetota bacterium]